MFCISLLFLDFGYVFVIFTTYIRMRISFLQIVMIKNRIDYSRKPL